MKKLMMHCAGYVVITSCFFFSLIVLFPLVLFPQRFMVYGMRHAAALILFFARFFWGIRYRIEGDIPRNTSCIIASKHQSTWETLVFLVLLDNPLFILKSSLLKVPFLGFLLWKTQMIGVRGKKTNFVEEAASRMQYNTRPLVIFPEGTRTTAGVRTPLYRSGVFALYAHLHVPVIPVALNAGLFWKRRGFYKNAGEIVMLFLPPIAPGMSKQAFMHTLQNSVEDASMELYYQARTAP